ncbi:MAG: MerR family transcriptional regulator [Gammaproteobacteria bacterium]
MHLKIGELARRTGITIRALRHYDDIGLLSPSARTQGGFRLYDRADVARLYRIQALCRLNLPLAEIGRVLDAACGAFPDLVDQQIALLNQQIESAVALRDHLTALRTRQDGADSLTMDDWLGAIEQMSAAARYFSAEEREALALGAAVADEKAALAQALRALMARKAGPDSEDAKALGYRFIELLMREVGGDEALLMKYYVMHWNEAPLQAMSGIDRAGMTYIAHAMAHRRLDIYARYCSSEEMQRLRRHYIGATSAWPALIVALREHLARGTDPGEPEPQRLAREWAALSSQKTGGDEALAARLRHAFEQEPALRFGSGIDAPLLAYVAQALQQVAA